MSRDIPIYFVPIDIDTYQADLIFYNESLGEFQITIEASPTPPTIFETFNFEANVNENTEFNLDVKYTNRLLKSALETIINSETNKAKQKELKKNLFLAKEKTVYSVDFPKNNFSTHSTFTVDPVNNNDKSSDLLSTPLTLKFISKNVQTIEGDVILKSTEKANDFRIYRVIVKVKPKNIEGEIIFNCPLNQVIEQKIPIHNSNDRECIIKCDINQTPQKGYFTLGHSSEKKISKNITDFIILRFLPIEKINITGLLKLENKFTQENYFYNLIGNVDNPLAEDMIKISCKVREKVPYTLKFPALQDRDLTYEVETDLGDIITGENKFVVKRGVDYDYRFYVTPLLGMIYFGKITFVPDYRKTYQWWTVEVDAKCEVERFTITLDPFIRKSKSADLVLSNPTNETITYIVEYNGEFLSGDTSISLLPKEKKKTYSLLYSPLKVGKSQGLLKIYNDRVGEKLVMLNLVCKDFLVEHFALNAELGKCTDHSVYLDNPLEEEVQVYISQTNKSQYQVIPEKIILPKMCNREIIVRYTPSNLDFEESCDILFDTYKIGNWKFHFDGKGINPDTMPLSYINTYVGGSVSGNILFKNPFHERIAVTVELKSDINGIFKLMLNNKKITVDSLKIIQIPYSFFPKKLIKYNCEIIITVSSTLRWVFPVEGITEVKAKGLDFYFKTKAKKKLDTKVILDLSAVPEQIDINELSLEVKSKEEKYKNLIEKCLTLNLEYPVVKVDDDNPNKVPLLIKFFPLRPFKTECEVLLVKKSGGQWIYKMIFEALEGEPEDIIKIQSTIGQESFIKFNLQNIFTKNSRFIAYFSHDSSPEFSVKPKEGILDQSGRNGNIFLIGFLPIEYGKVKIGKLVIESDEIQWIFHVHGCHLDYVLPEVKSNILGKTLSSINKNDNSSNDYLKTTVSKFKKEKSDSRVWK